MLSECQAIDPFFSQKPSLSSDNSNTMIKKQIFVLHVTAILLLVILQEMMRRGVKRHVKVLMQGSSRQPNNYYCCLSERA